MSSFLSLGTSSSLSLLALLLTAEVASAQPGVTPPGASPEGAACSVCTVPQHYVVQSPRLTRAEAEILNEGEISSGQHVGGALAAWSVGFGLGHAIQGRWGKKGWVFTVGESLSLGMVFYALQNVKGECLDIDAPGNYYCEPDSPRSLNVALGAGLAFAGLRVWEIVDSLSGPAEHNRKVRELRARTGQQPYAQQLTPFVMPMLDGSGATAGLSARF